MAVARKHILSQGPVLGALGKTAFIALKQALHPTAPSAPTVPGPTFSATVAPRPADLVKDYVRHVGGDPSAYRNKLPPHLFPQWTFPLVFKTLEGLSYPLAKVLNGGCRLEIRGPLPQGEPLNVSARLESVDDDGRRAVLKQRVVTGTASNPEALVAELFVIVPLGGGKHKDASKASTKRDGDKKDRPRVSPTAREIAFWRLGPQAGLEFALLTGDFNPIHWVTPAARAQGFRNVILHGFSTLARAIEGMNSAMYAGRTDWLTSMDVKFTRPLVLPAKVGLYVEGNQLWVGDAPGGPAYLAGSFTTKESL